MKKFLLLGVGTSFALAGNILPQNFGNCIQISFFNKYNAPISLNDYMQIIKKYSCDNQIIYIGIENRIPGILKLSVNNDTKNFLLKHFKIQNYPAAVYIDKQLQKGVIAIKLKADKTLKVLFFGTDYKQVLNYIANIDIKTIAKEL
ncbi:hypothetical protein NAMH_0185 [Nautilia profundicola AmH]|uniref:Uncharacterized protein n=1 Tax=Nautilia profundicola (strain ATCC BAA-1463 / DSM 18972 / AmH) TaxID=598659 RepID=B9L7K2_NAUPA|nr:hypothetical protein [Nautilia profundicola]ACM93405.1 hypothetical protein NAMH_0185 [Nautilia profundicola AmH]